MRTFGPDQIEERQNIIALFSGVQENRLLSEFEDLLLEDDEIEENEKKILIPEIPIVTFGQDPYKSLYVLENQVNELKNTVQKLRFYLSEIENILPKSLK